MELNKRKLILESLEIKNISRQPLLIGVPDHSLKLKTPTSLNSSFKFK